VNVFGAVEDPLVLNSGPSARGWHRLQTAAECLQKYAFEYEVAVRPDISKKPPLVTGSLIHLILAHHHMRMKQEQEGKNPEEYMHPVEAVRLVASVNGTSKYVDKRVLPTYEAYLRQYRDDIFRRRIVGVEKLYDGTLDPSDGSPSYRLTGRIDLLYEDLGGRLWAEDLKTTARLTKNHRHYYTMSGQFKGYAHLVRQKNPHLAGFSVSLMQHTNPKFQREPLSRSPVLERQFVDRVVDIERSVERCQAEGRKIDEWPKAMSELVCYHRYGPCDHIDKCRFGEKAKKAGSFKVCF
jgi:hypothetical protein